MAQATEKTFDYRGLSYEDYKRTCQERGRRALPPQEAADLLANNRPAGKPDVIDWEMAAHFSPKANCRCPLGPGADCPIHGPGVDEGY